MLWYYFMYCFCSQKNHQCRDFREQGVREGNRSTGPSISKRKGSSSPALCAAAPSSRLTALLDSLLLPLLCPSQCLLQLLPCPKPPQKPDSLTVVMLQTKAVQGTVVSGVGLFTVLCMCYPGVSREQANMNWSEGLKGHQDTVLVISSETPSCT